MPRLIHLNGPPGIGKSTLARRYVDNHPGVLNLDIDTLCPLIGGWPNNIDETRGLARTLGLAMADTHLHAGHDVILPQYIRRLDQLERFETVAANRGAAFREIMLTDTTADDQLTDIRHARPAAIVVPREYGAIHQTYTALITALTRGRDHP